MLEEFFNNEVKYLLIQHLEADEDNYKDDYSEFVVVDGEESDYGIIRHYYGNNLLAVRTVHGGDSEYIEYTTFGKWFFKNKLINSLSNVLGDV
jgi:hypothetical protein